jgi:patatin-like phospholipase/acyl hydrolase
LLLLGGVRGVLTAGILRRLVKSGRFPTLLQDADLIAGTSTGGILALLFAAGYTPAQGLINWKKLAFFDIIYYYYFVI